MKLSIAELQAKSRRAGVDCRLSIAVIVAGFLGNVWMCPSASAEPEAANVRAHPEGADRLDSGDRESPRDNGGLWPTPKLMDLMLARWADQIGEEYELEPEQRTKVREQVGQRWSSFLSENRDAIEPLVTEFLELRMELQPPSKDAVKSWADKATPMYEKFRSQISGTNGDLRQVITPQQRVKFEMDAMQFAVGMQFAEGKLKQWQSGEFDPKDFWEPPASAREDREKRWDERRSRRQERRRMREERAAESKPPEKPQDQIAVEMDLWDKYVADFTVRYDLDEGQNSTVQSLLVELKERATAHRDRHRTDMERLEERIQKGGDANEQEEVKKQLVELYGPIDGMFAELQRRMQAVPTAEQFARVELEERPRSHEAAPARRDSASPQRE